MENEKEISVSRGEVGVPPSGSGSALNSSPEDGLRGAAAIPSRERLRVLVGCEFSGTVRDAFRALGHDALSCDLLPSETGGPHYQGDVRDVLGEGWNLAIFHPPCTYLCSSGLHWNRRGTVVDGRPRAELTEEALGFVRLLMDAPIPRIAVENPIGCISTRIRKPDQIIQPYHFGADASKSTCLWLKGLPPLMGTQYVEPRMVCPNCQGTTDYSVSNKGCVHCFTEAGLLRPRWANQTNSGQNRLGPSADRWAERSITYPGIAEAMASQWGDALGIATESPDPVIRGGLAVKSPAV